MVNLVAPAAIIMVNNDLSASVLSAIQRQFFITETIDGAEFDARIAADSNYPTEVKGNNLRVLVVRSFVEVDNRDKADIVLFMKAGLASVLKNNFGPPGQVYCVEKMYLSQFFNTI